MNPNKALWEKGDFTRIAASMRDERRGARRPDRRHRRASRCSTSAAATAPPRSRRRSAGADVLGVDIASEPRRGRATAGPRTAGLTNLTLPGGRRLAT